MSNEILAIILTNGRPNAVHTYNTLRKHGYSGPICLMVDDLDPTKEEYLIKYGAEVYIFNKRQYYDDCDSGDNSGDMRASLYARNASFDCATQRGFKYFIQLDDDYVQFYFKFDTKLDFFNPSYPIKSLDKIFEQLLIFYKATPLKSLAIAQGGDFIGGPEGQLGDAIQVKRKAMNFWLCSIERRFKFMMRMNDDVTTALELGKRGGLFFTLNQIALDQIPTQQAAGGMTDAYKDSGTYVKSFFTLMACPSSVEIRMMGTVHRRLHHFTNWNRSVPKIIPESFRKLHAQ